MRALQHDEINQAMKRIKIFRFSPENLQELKMVPPGWYAFVSFNEAGSSVIYARQLIGYSSQHKSLLQAITQRAKMINYQELSLKPFSAGEIIIGPQGHILGWSFKTSSYDNLGLQDSNPALAERMAAVRLPSAQFLFVREWERGIAGDYLRYFQPNGQYRETIDSSPVAAQVLLSKIQNECKAMVATQADKKASASDMKLVLPHEFLPVKIAHNNGYQVSIAQADLSGPSSSDAKKIPPQAALPGVVISVVASQSESQVMRSGWFDFVIAESLMENTSANKSSQNSLVLFLWQLGTNYPPPTALQKLKLHNVYATGSVIIGLHGVILAWSFRSIAVDLLTDEKAQQFGPNQMEVNLPKEQLHAFEDWDYCVSRGYLSAHFNIHDKSFSIEEKVLAGQYLKLLKSIESAQQLMLKVKSNPNRAMTSTHPVGESKKMKALFKPSFFDMPQQYQVFIGNQVENFERDVLTI